MTRLAVVGLGRQGSRHLRVASRAPGVVVTATVDPFADGTELAPHFEKLEHALDSVACDAAIVATPTPEHWRSVRTLVDAGIPVLVEKPMGVDVEEGRDLVAAAGAAGVLLAVGFVERFNPAVALVSAMLRRGTLGRPICLSFRRLGMPPRESPGIDVIHDLAIHDVDVFAFMAGAPARLVGASGWPDGKRAESAHLLLSAAGVNGAVQVNWRTPVRVRDFALTTESCFVEANYTTQRVEVVEPHTAEDFVEFGAFQTHYGSAKRIQLELRPAEPLAEQLKAFVAAVEGEEQPHLALGAAAVDALTVADAATAEIGRG